MVPGHLAAVGIQAKDEGRPDVGVFHLRDLRGWGLSKQLQEPHLRAQAFWLRGGHADSEQQDHRGENV